MAQVGLTEYFGYRNRSMAVTKKEAMAVIDAEIKWCRENLGYTGNVPKDFQSGFIDGLKQAKKLIRSLELNKS